MRHGASSARLRVAAWMLALGVAFAGSTASAAAFVDGALSDVPTAQKVQLAQPRPVQVLFQFKTKGVANNPATKLLKDEVFKAVRESGLFSQVGEGPVEGGALLALSIDNVPTEAPGDAFGKGFATGATFGLVGSKVADAYLGQADYSPAPGAPTLTRKLSHKVWTSLGLTSAPPNAIKADSAEAAVKIMARQLVANELNQLAGDPGFAPSAAAPAALSATPPPVPAVAPIDAPAPAPVQ